MICFQTDISFEHARRIHDEYLLPLASLLGLLRDRGIRFDAHEGDVAFVDAHALIPPVERPTVIFDRTDGGFLWWRFEPGDGQARRLLNDPLVLGMLKIARYGSLEAYNAPQTDRAIHAQRIQEQHAAAIPLGAERATPALSPEGYRKLRLSPGFWAFDTCAYPAATPIDLRAARPFDVFCAATLNYGCPAISWHRRRALDVLASIRSARVMIGRGRLLAADTYQRLLTETKICVSPWGYGETCHRDYEALLACCILIKPRTDFSVSLLPLDDHHYFACRPDFADLPELIDAILKQWPKLREHRQRCREYVLAARRPSRLADQFAAELLAAASLTSNPTQIPAHSGPRPGQRSTLSATNAG